MKWFPLDHNLVSKIDMWIDIGNKKIYFGMVPILSYGFTIQLQSVLNNKYINILNTNIPHCIIIEFTCWHIFISNDFKVTNFIY